VITDGDGVCQRRILSAWRGAASVLRSRTCVSWALDVRAWVHKFTRRRFGYRSEGRNQAPSPSSPPSALGCLHREERPRKPIPVLAQLAPLTAARFKWKNPSHCRIWPGLAFPNYEREPGRSPSHFCSGRMLNGSQRPRKRAPCSAFALRASWRHLCDERGRLVR
jgi:hypothetical protein